MYLKSLSPDVILWLILVVSFLVTYFSIPSIVSVARTKKLYDEPSRRKSHIQQIPTLGGVAIFAGITLSTGLFIDYSILPSLQYILVACMIMFFVGIKDDILVIAPIKKLICQIVAALIVIIPGNIRFTSLHGFLGFNQIPLAISLLLTVFVIIVIINSFNLIDGIDGLAASIGMLTTAFFGIWFYISGNIEYCLLCVAVFGTLLAFFRYNVFGKKNKIFMGDTGSLILGLLMSVEVIIFNEKNVDFTSAYAIYGAPAVSFAVLIIPLYDTIRVFVIRMLRKRSPFAADKNHIHHCLLKLGHSHGRATCIIVFANICFIALALILQKFGFGIIKQMFVILTIAIALSFYLEYLVRKANQPAMLDKTKQGHLSKIHHKKLRRKIS